MTDRKYSCKLCDAPIQGKKLYYYKRAVVRAYEMGKRVPGGPFCSKRCFHEHKCPGSYRADTREDTVDDKFERIMAEAGR